MEPDRRVSPDNNKNDKNDQLVGWKAIASALSVSVRTAQRWNTVESMPIRYHKHLRRSTPAASLSDLMRWRAQSRQSGPPRAPDPAAKLWRRVPGNLLPRALAGGLALAVLIAAGIAVAYSRRSLPSLPASALTLPAQTLQTPQHVYGVQKVEGRNAFAMCDLVTGQCGQEWRFCPKSPGYTVPFYSGFIITKLKVTMTGNCQFIDDTSGDMELFVIARGKERDDPRRDPYNYIYRELTYAEKRFSNWEDRPVLAHNCQSTPDDSATVCAGGEARFLEGGEL